MNYLTSEFLWITFSTSAHDSLDYKTDLLLSSCCCGGGNSVVLFCRGIESL